MATTKTELYNNGTLVATKTSAPFNTFDWTPASGEVGSASLTVKRYEDGVLVATSAAVGGTVDAASGTYDADYQAALDYMTANSIAHPSSTEKSATNQKIIDLKSNGVWSQLDQLLIFNSEVPSADYNRVDLKGLRLATDVGTMTYPTGGKKGDGSTAYIKTGYIPSTDAVNQSINDASVGFKLFDETTKSSVYGSRDTAGSISGMMFYLSGGNLTYRFYQSTSASTSAFSLLGHNHISKLSGSVEHKVDNVLKATVTQNAASELSNRELYLMALNENGTPSGISNVGFSWFYSGSNLRDKVSVINTILG
jgi:hypothetical protein